MNSETYKKLALQAATQAASIRIRSQIPHDSPVDSISLAEKHDCEVRLFSLPSLEGVYSPNPRSVIVLGTQRPAGRRNFTCAHELGHHIFKHGARIDELTKSKEHSRKKPEEFLADVFAGYVLMSQIAVKSTIKKRNWNASALSPAQIHVLSSYFGVGYSTFVNHLAWSLNEISWSKADELLKIQPKEIKANYGASPEQEVVFVDFHWKSNCPVNLEIGDILVLPSSVEVNPNNRINFVKNKGNNAIWQAVTPGYTNAFSEDLNWAVNIRVSRKNYEGIASYRFFEEIGGK